MLLLRSDLLLLCFSLFTIIILKHFSHIFLIERQEVQQSLVLELEFLLNLDVGLDKLLPDVVHQHFDASVDEALQLVDNHLLQCSER